MGTDFRPRPGHHLLVLVDPTAELPAGWTRSPFAPTLAWVVATPEILASDVTIAGYTDTDGSPDT